MNDFVHKHSSRSHIQPLPARHSSHCSKAATAGSDWPAAAGRPASSRAMLTASLTELDPLATASDDLVLEPSATAVSSHEISIPMRLANVDSSDRSEFGLDFWMKQSSNSSHHQGALAAGKQRPSLKSTVLSHTTSRSSSRIPTLPGKHNKSTINQQHNRVPQSQGLAADVVAESQVKLIQSSLSHHSKDHNHYHNTSHSRQQQYRHSYNRKRTSNSSCSLSQADIPHHKISRRDSKKYLQLLLPRSNSSSSSSSSSSSLSELEDAPVTLLTSVDRESPKENRYCLRRSGRLLFSMWLDPVEYARLCGGNLPTSNTSTGNTLTTINQHSAAADQSAATVPSGVAPSIDDVEDDMLMPELGTYRLMMQHSLDDEEDDKLDDLTEEQVETLTQESAATLAAVHDVGSTTLALTDTNSDNGEDDDDDDGFSLSKLHPNYLLDNNDNVCLSVENEPLRSSCTVTPDLKHRLLENVCTKANSSRKRRLPPESLQSSHPEEGSAISKIARLSSSPSPHHSYTKQQNSSPVSMALANQASPFSIDMFPSFADVTRRTVGDLRALEKSIFDKYCLTQPNAMKFLAHSHSQKWEANKSNVDQLHSVPADFLNELFYRSLYCYALERKAISETFGSDVSPISTAEYRKVRDEYTYSLKRVRYGLSMMDELFRHQLMQLSADPGGGGGSSNCNSGSAGGNSDTTGLVRAWKHVIYYLCLQAKAVFMQKEFQFQSLSSYCNISHYENADLDGYHLLSDGTPVTGHATLLLDTAKASQNPHIVMLMAGPATCSSSSSLCVSVPGPSAAGHHTSKQPEQYESPPRSHDSGKGSSVRTSVGGTTTASDREHGSPLLMMTAAAAAATATSRGGRGGRPSDLPVSGRGAPPHHHTGSAGLLLCQLYRIDKYSASAHTYVTADAVSVRLHRQLTSAAHLEPAANCTEALLRLIIYIRQAVAEQPSPSSLTHCLHQLLLLQQHHPAGCPPH